MSDESRAVENLSRHQLEKISRAVRDLEGLPVDFKLARKLSEIQHMIADMHPLPVAPVSDTPAIHSCNRHSDCKQADEKARAKGATFGASHCHDDECEDCFGC